jgi:ubiquinone/menaquinone biosynthesis C-methylase UbiE
MDKQQITLGFNVVSTDYDNPALRHLLAAANRLVELASIHPGQKVLDIATGTGNAAIAAARTVGENGQVIGIDLAKNMLEKAQQKVSAAGLKNVELQEGDATALHFTDNSFDVAICASGIYCLPDILSGLREWYRVTKPNGRVAFSSWGETADKAVFSLFKKRLKHYIASSPTANSLDEALGRVDSAQKCRELLQAVGFENIEVSVEQLGYYVKTLEECWDSIWNTGLRIPLLHLEPQKVEQFKAEYLAEVEALTTEQGIWVDRPAIFARARKPTGSH